MPQVSPAARKALSEAGSDIKTGLVSLMIPAALLYLALYALVKKKTGVFVMLDWMAIFAFAANGTLVVLECSVARSLQLFAGKHHSWAQLPASDLQHDTNDSYSCNWYHEGIGLLCPEEITS